MTTPTTDGRSPGPTMAVGLVPATSGISLAAVLAVGVLLVASSARAEQIGPYSARNLTLGRGTLRLDAGPPDWGYFHPGGPHRLNDSRGFRLRHSHSVDDPTWAWVGLGAAFGITDGLEVGLVMPYRVTPDATLDDLELYGRIALLKGDCEIAAQVTGQVPIQGDAALGLGVPMLLHAGKGFRLDTGIQAELLFMDETLTNVDVPLALTKDIGSSLFLGLRSGAYLWDMNALIVPAGVHAGGVVAEGCVDIAGWFIWPDFVDTGRERTFETRIYEVGLGVNARIR